MGARSENTVPVSEAALGGFKLLEHTADVGVVATGDTFAETLGWLARGMFSVIVDLDGVEPRYRNDRRNAETAFALGLDVGSQVEAGQVIGLVGSSSVSHPLRAGLPW